MGCDNCPKNVDHVDVDATTIVQTTTTTKKRGGVSSTVCFTGCLVEVSVCFPINNLLRFWAVRSEKPIQSALAAKPWPLCSFRQISKPVELISAVAHTLFTRFWVDFHLSIIFHEGAAHLDHFEDSIDSFF